MCDLPNVSVIVECRRMKFMNNMLDSEHFRCIGLMCINYWYFGVFIISFFYFYFFIIGKYVMYMYIVYVLPHWQNKDMYIRSI